MAMMAPGPAALAGRTVQEVTDISLQEQLYLFERARLFKRGVASAGQAVAEVEADSAAGVAAPPLCEVLDADAPLKMDDPDSTVYLIFMEGSTRTRESLRNAAVYHGVKVNEFQAETSSFQKNETITDTMKMLSVYSTQRSVFVIRSPLEGVCRWLQAVLPGHAEKFGIPTPSFLNAGDGRYTHPVGELADLFSLLEQARWDRSEIHVALVGDLAHGRTAHSKVDGLKVFKKVRVDLVAPPALEYPVEYRNRMRAQGFEVREFASVEEYLDKADSSLAATWYFYQPQFKRCGDLPPGAMGELRGKVAFKAEWQERLPRGACFFQTLPRDKASPIIPLALDSTPLNGWDRHASNTYYVHVVLLGMLFGKIGRGIPEDDLPAHRLSPAKGSKGGGGPGGGLGIPRASSLTSMMSSVYPFAGQVVPASLPSFLQPVDLSAKDHLRQPERAVKGGVVPIRDGVVVDHIGKSADPATCWEKLRLVRNILAWNRHSASEGVYKSTSSKETLLFKAIISMPNFDFETVSVPQMKTLASIAPGCTINAIKNSKVVSKYRLSVPERIYNLPDIACANAACVSHPPNRQRDVVGFFQRVPFYETSVLPNCKASEYLFVCRYCKWPHTYEDIWKV